MEAKVFHRMTAEPNVRCHICNGEGVIEVPDNCDGLEDLVDLLSGMEM